MEKFEFGPIQTKWLESLEQHPERQMKDALGLRSPDGSYKCCCLGELGIIGGICGFDEVGELRTIDEDIHRTSKTTLSNVHEKVGLHNGCGSVVGEKEGMLAALTIYNDGKHTWPEIAAIVRANPTAYFSKSV